MKALLIGGTGTISMAVTHALSLNKDWDVYLVNRGNRSYDVPSNVHVICADIYNEGYAREQLKDLYFDCVCDFICFDVGALERDYRLFKDRTRQFIFISSASAYHKPLKDYVITEGTSLANPYFEYSRNKIACERYLMERYEKDGFPITIVRPSHTYDTRSIPVGAHGYNGTWQIAKRMLEGKPVIVHGDGTSLWTMTFNEDFAKGFIGLMGNPHAIGEAFQITSDESLTWNQIYRAIADALNVEYKPYYVSSEFLADVYHYDFRGILTGDQANTVVFDNTKIKRAVPGFVCSTRFEQGVKKTVENILAHHELQIEDPEFDRYCDEIIAALEDAKQRVRANLNH